MARIGFLLILPLVGLCCGQSALAETMTSQDGRFSIETPGTPQLRYEWIDRRRDRNWTFAFNAESKPVATAIDRDRRYNFIVATMITKLKGMMRRQDPVKLGDITGREIVFDLQVQGKPRVIRERIFFTDNRFYQAFYTGPLGTETEPDVDAFFNGLKIN